LNFPDTTEAVQRQNSGAQRAIAKQTFAPTFLFAIVAKPLNQNQPSLGRKVEKEQFSGMSQGARETAPLCRLE
jgi:hypothetical protein